MPRIKRRRKKNLTLRRYQQTESYLKGLLFEIVMKELVKKSGFSQEDYLLQANLQKTKLHGRGAPHQIDILGVFRLGIPFIHPLLLVGEAKNFRYKIGLKEVRAFLGTYIDIIQFSRINTKAPMNVRRNDLFEPKYTYCPVFFSMKGFKRTAETLMFAHGINYFSYENSAIMEQIEKLVARLLKQVRHNRIVDTDYKQFRELSSLKNLRTDARKETYDAALEKLTRYLSSVSSYVGVLDKRFPIHILTRTKNIPRKPVEVRIERVTEKLLVIKSVKNRQYGQFSLTDSFLQDYLTFAAARKQLDQALRQIDIIVPKENTLLVLNLKIHAESRDTLIAVLVPKASPSKQSPDIIEI